MEAIFWPAGAISLDFRYGFPLQGCVGKDAAQQPSQTSFRGNPE
jgi:hypothetical protein